MTWKYRGQLTPAEDRLSLALRFTGAGGASEEQVLTADASVWKGSTRVYEIRNIALGIGGRRTE